MKRHLLSLAAALLVGAAVLAIADYGNTHAPCEWFRPQIRPERCR